MPRPSLFSPGSFQPAWDSYADAPPAPSKATRGSVRRHAHRGKMGPATVPWRFTSVDAKAKLKHAYPSVP
jgi:hypothetical protein